MSIEFLSVRRDHLMSAAALLPVAQRASFFATLFVGPEAIPSIDVDAADIKSFAITPEQARDLKSKIDEATWEVIKKAVTDAKDDVGVITWQEVKKLTGVMNWAQFAQGRMGGLHRSLRKMEGVPAGAVLLYEGEGWVEDGKGDYSVGTLAINGPAVRTLRKICGLSEDN